MRKILKNLTWWRCLKFKVLGDVCEAIFGYVFLDSGHYLSVVWSVYRRLCPTLDKVVANPPLYIKKQLLEKFPTVGSVIFSSATLEGGGTVSVTVERVSFGRI
jgi:hypothetical protein